MKNTRKTICCVLLAFLLLAQLTPVSATPLVMDNMDSEMEMARPILNEKSVMQTISSYFQRRQAFLVGGDVADFSGAIPGVIQGEREHLQALCDEGISFVSSAIVFDEIFCEDEYADVTLSETATFRKGMLHFTEIINHTLFVCYNDDNTLVVAGDGYAEFSSSFQSHSYSEPYDHMTETLQT